MVRVLLALRFFLSVLEQHVVDLDQTGRRQLQSKRTSQSKRGRRSGMRFNDVV